MRRSFWYAIKYSDITYMVEIFEYTLSMKIVFECWTISVSCDLLNSNDEKLTLVAESFLSFSIIRKAFVWKFLLFLHHIIINNSIFSSFFSKKKTKKPKRNKNFISFFPSPQNSMKCWLLRCSCTHFFFLFSTIAFRLIMTQMWGFFVFMYISFLQNKNANHRQAFGVFCDYRRDASLFPQIKIIFMHLTAQYIFFLSFSLLRLV